MALKWVSVPSLPPKEFATAALSNPAGQTCYKVGSYTSWFDEWGTSSYYVCQDDGTGGGTNPDPGTTATLGRITVNGSTAYSKPYEIKTTTDMSTTNMGMSRITGTTWLSKSFVSTTSTGGQTWTNNSYGEGISVTTPSGLRIYYGGKLLTLVEGSSVVSPKERYSLHSGTASNITFGSYFLTAADTQKAYILLQGGGGGGGKGGGWGVLNSAKDGGGGGGGAGGLILVKYTLGRNNKYNFTVGSGGSGATGSGGTGGSGGTSTFSYDGQSYAWAYGGSGGKGKSGAAAEGGTGGTTDYYYNTSRMAYVNGSDGGPSNAAGQSKYLSELTSLTNTFGFTYKTGTGTMSTFRNSAATWSGGSSTGDGNRGQAGGGGASLYANGGSITKTTASAGSKGSGGGGGTSKNGGGGPSGAAGGNGFVYVYF